MNSGSPNPSEPFPRELIPHEVVEWARQTFDEKEFLADVREIEANGGGLQLDDFIAEIEARAVEVSGTASELELSIAFRGGHVTGGAGTVRRFLGRQAVRMLSPTDLESLLYHLCVKYGFCLQADEYQRLCADPPTEVTAFVDAVYRAEGLDPATANQRVYGLVHAAVTQAFRGGVRLDAGG